MDLPEFFMNVRKGSESQRYPSQNSFITIDDLARTAEELLNGIIRLSQYKYPLGIRKGRKFKKEVIEMAGQSEDSLTVKARSKTYFFDIRKTKNGKPYLSISESRLKTEGKEQQRSTIFIFPEDAANLKNAFSEMVDKLS